MSVLGTLSGSGFSWPLTTADALWTARMCIGEEGNPLAGQLSVPYEACRSLVSTMLRRLVSVSAAQRRKAWPSLTQLLIGTERSHGFSTPVCIIHRSEGTEFEMERRAAVSRIEWKAVPTPVRAAVVDTLTGLTPLSQAGSGADDFAACWLVERKLDRNPDWHIVASPAKNCLVSTARGRRIAEPHVSPKTNSQSLLALFGIVAIAAKVLA